jgi:hypothetical protein
VGNNRRNKKLKKMDRIQEKALKMVFIIHRTMYVQVKNFQFSQLPFFIGGAVTFTLGPCCSLLRRIPDKNDRCAFTRGSRGEVMIFFEKKKVLGVEPNGVLNI